MSSISEQIVHSVISSGDKALTDKVISVLVDKGVILEDNILFEDITDLAEADGETPHIQFEKEAATMAAIEDYLKDCPSYSNIGLRKLLS